MEVENNDLESACKVLQGQRGELMDRLKYIMQQQWHETLNLFQSEEKNNMINTLSTNHLSSTLTNDAENLNSSFTQHETSLQPPHNGNVGGNRTTEMHNLSVKDLNSDKMMNQDKSNKLNSQYPSYQEQSLNQLHQLASVNDKLSTSSFTQYNNSSTHQPTLNQPTLNQQQQQLFLQMLLRQQENNQQQQIEYNQQQEQQRTQLEQQVLQQKQLEQQNQQHLRNQQQQSQEHHMKNNFSFKPKQGSSNLSTYGGTHKNNAKQTESNQTETLNKSSSNAFPYSVHTEDKVFDHSQYMKAEKPFLNNEKNSNLSNTTAQYPNNSISENNHGNNGSIDGNRSFKNKSQLVARGNPFSLVYDDLEQVSSSGYSQQENASKQRLPQNEVVDQSHGTLNSSRDTLQASHNDRGFQRKLNEQSKKQEQLSHFIEKLLQKSPGQPNDVDPHPPPPNGDDSVAGPSINVEDINHLINEYTPKNINKSQPSAFKKSVLRNKNTNSRIASDKRHNAPRDQNNQVNKHTTENVANVRNEVSEQIEHLNEKQLKQLMLILNNRTSAEQWSLKADPRDHELSNQASPADVFQRLHKNILKEKPSKQVTSNRTAVPKDHRKTVKENRSVTAKGSTRSTTKVNSTRK